MQIAKLKLKNFMNVEDCDLSFYSGINVIGGRNGMGKSTLFVAQAFCFTGYKRGDSWKDYIRTNADSMSIDMTVYRFPDDDPFVFHIEGSSSSSSMSREIRYKDQYARNNECDALLEKYFDLDMMENTLFHLQDSVSITALTPAKRRDLLKKVFNSDFSSITTKIKEDTDSEKVKVRDYENSLGIFSSLTFEKKILDRVPRLDIEEEKRNIDLKKQVMDLLKENIIEKQNSIKTFADTSSSYRKSLDSLNQQIQNIQKGMVLNPDIKQNITTLEQDLVELGKEEYTLLVDINFREERFNSFLEDEKELEVQSKKELTLLVQNESQLKSLEKQKQAFEKDGICPTCGQVCSTDHKNNLETEINTYQSICLEQKKVVDDLALQKANLNKTKTEISNELNRLKSSLAEIKNKIALNNLKHSQLQKEIVDKELWIEQNTPVLESLKKQYEELVEKLETLTKGYFEEEIFKEISILRSQIEEKENEIRESEEKIKKVETIIILNNEKETYNKEIAEKEQVTKEKIQFYTNSLIELKKNISELEYVRTVFDTELPTYIMSQACSYLTKGMNSFMSQTKDQFEIVLKQDAKGIDFMYKTGVNPNYIKAKMASGFESALMTLGFKFTVAQAYNAHFIIFDEPDKSADKESSVKLMEIIANMNDFSQIFITTHQENAMDYLQGIGATVIRVENGKYFTAV